MFITLNAFAVVYDCKPKSVYKPAIQFQGLYIKIQNKNNKKKEMWRLAPPVEWLVNSTF